MRRALLIVAACAASAHADVTSAVKGATVDWSDGTIVARGIGPADRHAPAPAVARDAAKVRAIDAAKAVVTAAAKALPGAHDLADDAVADLVAHDAVIRDLDVGTDGSVSLDLVIPIEAVRVAISGPRAAAPTMEPAPAVVIVDATHVQVKPRIGLAIGGWTGPTLFVDKTSVDGRHVKATKATSKAISIDGDPPAAGALVIVVIGGKT